VSSCSTLAKTKKKNAAGRHRNKIWMMEKIPFPGKSLTVLPHENFVALQGL
jgi:hypothetical protein